MLSHSVLNFPVLFTLLLISAADIGVKTNFNCTTFIGGIISLILGCFFGFLWSALIFKKYPELLYHTDYISNKLACTASPQRFKCSVYKNGELLGQSTS